MSKESLSSRGGRKADAGCSSGGRPLGLPVPNGRFGEAIPNMSFPHVRQKARRDSSRRIPPVLWRTLGGNPEMDPRHIFGEEHQVLPRTLSEMSDKAHPEKCSRKGRAAKCSAHIIVGNTSKLPRLVLAHWRLHWARALKHMRLCRSAAPLHSGMTLRVKLLRLLRSLAMTVVIVLILFPTSAHAANSSLESALGKIPVQNGGRVKPFQSFAKESVLLITGKTSWEKQNPTVLVWRWMAEPQVWSAKPMIPVQNSEIRKLFSSDVINNRIAPNLVLNNFDFLKSVNSLQEKQDKEKNLTAAEKKQLELYQRARIFDEIANGRIPGFIPHPENPKTAWLPFEAILQPQGVEILTNVFPVSVVQKLQAAAPHFLDRIREGDLEAALTSAQAFASSLEELLLSREIMLDRSKINQELLYLKLKPFQLALVFYLLMLLISMDPRLKFATKLSKSVRTNLATLFGGHAGMTVGFSLFFTGFLIHTFGFVLRVLISGRPPVTNMYESIIWVTWGTALFSIIFWFFYRSPLLPKIAAAVAIIGLLVAESFPTLLDPSISPLVPVLRSNLWLTIHVLTITLGYGAFALNWGASHALLYALAFNVKKELTNNLTEYVYRSLQVGVILLSCGTILGGVWASYSWGRFWGWDPKETWALIAILAYLAVLHSRTAGWIDTFGVGFWSALCFLTVLMAWYGVNFVLGVGLHSYGFGGGGLHYVLTFVLIDLFFLFFLKRRFEIRRQITESRE